MELVFVAHRCRAPLEIADVAVVVGHDQCALKLSRARGVDAEVGRELHRAAHSFGDIDKRSVAEYRRVERREEIVAVAHYFAQIFAHQIGIVLDRLAERAEDDAQLGEFLAMGGLDRHRVHHGVHSHAGEHLLLLEGDTQAVERIEQLRIDLVEALGRLFLFGRGIVADRLIVDRRYVEVSPCRHRQCLPMAERLQPEVKQPVGFAFFLRYEAYDVLVESSSDDVAVNVGDKAVFIIGARDIAQHIVCAVCAGIYVFVFCHLVCK